MQKAVIITILGCFVIVLAFSQITLAKQFKEKNIEPVKTQLIAELESGNVDAELIKVDEPELSGEVVVGSWVYFVEPESTPSSYKETVLNRVCFEPSQNETINQGEMFCFRNTSQALDLLVETKANLGQDCQKFWGIMNVQIKDLSDDVKDMTKDNKCVKSGSCEVNEATLVAIKEVPGFNKINCSN